MFKRFLLGRSSMFALVAAERAAATLDALKKRREGNEG